MLTTTTSSSMCITVIGSEVTGTSCLQHTNRNQLNVALFRLRLQVSHNTYVVHVRNARRRTRIHTRTHPHTHIHSYVHAIDASKCRVVLARVDSTPVGSTVDQLGLKLTGNQVRRCRQLSVMSRRNGAAARRGRSPIDSHSRRPRLIAIRCRQSAVDGDGDGVRTHAALFRDSIHARIDCIQRPTAKGGKIVPSHTDVRFRRTRVRVQNNTRARSQRRKNIAALLYNVKVNERRAFRIVRRRNRTRTGAREKKTKKERKKK